MEKKPKVVTASADDWAAMWIDGELKFQDHGLYSDQIFWHLEKLGIIEWDHSLEDDAVCYTYAEEEGEFPADVQVLFDMKQKAADGQFS